MAGRSTVYQNSPSFQKAGASPINRRLIYIGSTQDKSNEVPEAVAPTAAPQEGLAQEIHKLTQSQVSPAEQKTQSIPTMEELRTMKPIEITNWDDFKPPEGYMPPINVTGQASNEMNQWKSQLDSRFPELKSHLEAGNQLNDDQISQITDAALSNIPDAERERHGLILDALLHSDSWGPEK